MAHKDTITSVGINQEELNLEVEKIIKSEFCSSIRREAFIANWDREYYALIIDCYLKDVLIFAEPIEIHKAIKAFIEK